MITTTSADALDYELIAQILDYPAAYTNECRQEQARLLRAALSAPPATPPADAVCVICHSDEPHTGACGSSDPRALRNQNSADAAGGGREDMPYGVHHRRGVGQGLSN